MAYASANRGKQRIMQGKKRTYPIRQRIILPVYLLVSQTMPYVC